MGLGLCLALAALAACLPASLALSYPLCQEGGAVWVTERPFTDPVFPGANFWYFCDGGLNVLGTSVDFCVQNGTVCTQAVGTALCKMLGYDEVYPDDVTVDQAKPGEPVRSLTGEYCLRKGVYAPTLPKDLADLPGQPCLKFNKLTCVRKLETMAAALDQADLEQITNATATAPASGAASGGSASASRTYPQTEVRTVTLAPAAETAPNSGRRLLLRLGPGQ